MAFRLSNDNPVYLDDDGLPCAGGSLTFSRSGGSTALNVFDGPDLGTSLGAVLTLDASGRAVDFWMDSSAYQYRCILKNAAAEVIWQRDNIAELGSTGEPPPDPTTGDDGQVWTTNGTTADWETPSYVPDMTGHAGKVLGTDGAIALWQAQTTYDADNLPGGFDDNTGSGYFDSGTRREVWGGGTIPTAAALTSSVAVTFPVPFADTTYRLQLTAGAVNVTSNSPSGSPSMQWTNKSTTGFTAHAFVGEENTGGTDVINSSIPFDYYATGTKPA